MASLSTWISALTSCTTIFSSGSLSLLHPEPQKAVVNSEIPWIFLSMPDATIPDCTTLLIHNYEDLNNATDLVLKTRREITFVLVLDDNILSNSSEFDWNSYQTYFDIHIIAIGERGQVKG